MMSIPRGRMHCCLKRVGKCTTRIEPGKQRTKLGKGDLWNLFTNHVGEEDAEHFNENDVMCQKCYFKIRNLPPTRLRIRENLPSGPVSPKRLRCEKVYHNENSIQELAPRAPIILNAPILRFNVEPENEMSPTLSTQSDDIPDIELDAYEYENSVALESSNNTEEQSSERSVLESQVSVTSSIMRRLIPGAMQRGEVPMVIPGVQSLISCESRCCVCQSRTGRSRIPASASLSLLLKTNIIMPENNRTCKEHLHEGHFTDEAMKLIQATKGHADITGLQVAKWIQNLIEQQEVKRSVTCEYCGKVCNSRPAKHLHKMSHGKRFQCRYCEVTCGRPDSCRRHERKCRSNPLILIQSQKAPVVVLHRDAALDVINLHREIKNMLKDSPSSALKRKKGIRKAHQ